MGADVIYRRPYCMASWSSQGLCYRCISWREAHHRPRFFVFSSAMDHCSGLHLLQREAPLMGGEGAAYADIWVGI